MRRAILGIAAVTAIPLLALVILDFADARSPAPNLLPQDQRATSVLIEKGARRLTLLKEGQPFRTFEISLGTNPVGHKQQEGDRRTPEGVYVIDFKNARSRFHLALRISYPSAEDRKRAQDRDAPPGSDIMIHGIRNGLGWLGHLHLSYDWTDGCIAVANPEIQDIWAMVDIGTPVEIRP